LTPAVEKVLVIGSGGAGKSTLAGRIAAATGLPLVHLDRLYWHPGWVPTPDAEWEQVVRGVIAGDRWVIDGNYGGTMALRLAAADTVVFLDVPRIRCVIRVLRRVAQHRGRSRSDTSPGCPEHVSREFLWWIWRYPATRRAGVLALLADFERGGGWVVVLRNDAEVDGFVSELS
jgi:adenylate kinase family enzyme